jgi:hypothetical protein
MAERLVLVLELLALVAARAKRLVERLEVRRVAVAAEIAALAEHRQLLEVVRARVVERLSVVEAWQLVLD